MESLETVLPRMLAKKAGNLWMKFEHSEVYIRINNRCIGEKSNAELVIAFCVEIANIKTPEHYERKGTFHRMIAKIQSMTDFPLYLEKSRPDFAEALIERHGWIKLKQDIFGRYDLVLSAENIKPYNGHWE